MKRDGSAAENYAGMLAALMTRQAFNITELAERTGHHRRTVRAFLEAMHGQRLVYRKTPGRYGRWALQPTPGFYPDAAELVETRRPGADLSLAWRKAA